AEVGRAMGRNPDRETLVEMLVLETVADVLAEVFAVRFRAHQPRVDRPGHIEVPVDLAAVELDFEDTPDRVVADATQGFRLDPPASHRYSKLPTESCARLSKRVYSPKNFSFTEPVGPLRCLPMMTSARPLSGEFSLL